MKEVNYNIVQGDSFLLSLTYNDSNGDPINLTGASALMEIRDQPGGKMLCATASGSAPSVALGIDNDLYADAVDLSTLESPMTFSTASTTASLEVGEPFSTFADSGDYYGYSVWFMYTPSATRVLSLSASGTVTASGEDYVGIGIYTGSQVDDLTLIDHMDGNPQSVLMETELQADQTYYITAATYKSSNSGSVSPSPASWVITGDWDYSGEAATSNDGISITAAAGQIDINISPQKTKLFNYPRAAYQLQLTTAGGVKTTLLTGWFLVNAGVID